MFRLFGLTISLLAGLTACQRPNTDPAGAHVESTRAPSSAATFRSDPQYLLTARGDYVLSNPPPGVEIGLGSKLVRRVDAVETVGKSLDR